MELEKQVCSLENSERLKELGFEQKSLWYWCCEENELIDKWYIHQLSKNNMPIFEDDMTFYSAYTVAELGDMLPYKLRMEDEDYWLNMSKLKCGDFDIRYSNSRHTKVYRDVSGIFQGTEADARAKCLIYLKENNLIEE